MRNNISKKIAVTLMAAAISSANAGGLEFSKNDKLDSLYLGASTSHAFKTKASGDVEKSSGYDSSFPNIDVYFGKYITDHYRIELSGGFRKFEYSNKFSDGEDFIADKQKVSIFRVMLNNYYDITTINEKFTPYVMAGLGISYISPGKMSRVSTEAAHNETYSFKSSSSLSYQAGLGVDFKMSDKTTLDLGFRHINYGTMKSNDFGAGNRKLKSNEVLLGIKFDL